jgi:hypothetical protein
MNVQLCIAAALLLIGTTIHAIGGEKTNIKHLKRSKIPTNLKIELRMSWYLAAIDMGVSGLHLLFLAFNGSTEGARLLVGFVAIRVTFYGVVALLLLLATQRDHLFQVPQWILLVVIGLMTWWGMS